MISEAIVFQILKHAERHFAAGHGYLATVVGVEEEGLIHLSLTGQWMCCPVCSGKGRGGEIVFFFRGHSDL